MFDRRKFIQARLRKPQVTKLTAGGTRANDGCQPARSMYSSVLPTLLGFYRIKLDWGIYDGRLEVCFPSLRPGEIMLHLLGASFS